MDSEKILNAKITLLQVLKFCSQAWVVIITTILVFPFFGNADSLKNIIPALILIILFAVPAVGIIFLCNRFIDRAKRKRDNIPEPVKNKYVVYSLKAMLLVSLVFIGFLGWKGYDIAVQFRNTIYPPSMRTFNYDMDPVEFTIGGVDYSMPEAYLELKPSLDKDGNVQSISIWASMNDDMAPWTVSESFKRKDTSGVVSIEIGGKKFPDFHERRIKHEIEYEEKHNLQGTYKVKFETYKDIFLKYTQLINGYIYLIPKVNEPNPFLIQCPKPENPNYLCTVTTNYKDMAYDFKIPFGIAEKYLDYDKQVKKLIDRLIVKKGE